MKYTEIVENNKADLNSLLIFDTLSKGDVLDFIRRNNLEDKISPSAIEEKWNEIDYYMQRIKSSHTDNDLKRALKQVFKQQQQQQQHGMQQLQQQQQSQQK